MDMSRIESSLAQLEGRLRLLFEGLPAAHGIPRKLHKQLAKELILAMRSHQAGRVGNSSPQRVEQLVPDRYTLLLSSDQAELLLTHPAELDQLTRILESEAIQAGLVFAAPAMVRVVAAPQSTAVKILAEYSQASSGDTRTTGMVGILPDGDQAGARFPNAFLIVNGLATFPLDQSVINIGRDPSNQLRLEDRRVSRLHAQLRLVQGRFVIFDLDSKGGTFVNDVAVTSHVLNEGDVILLGGVPLVYGQEEDARDGFTQELPGSTPPPPEVL